MIRNKDGKVDNTYILKHRLTLGTTVMTRGIATVGEEDAHFMNEVLEAFTKYCECDWGDLDKEDSQMNDEALENGNDRILAHYKTSRDDIYIITEWDRSATTILFTHEY